MGETKKKNTKIMKAVLIISAVLLAASSVSAECPNGCSGHGDCGAFDMCTCYRNFEGADCAHRTCPYGVAHTTTPQGDLNLDGDLLDNSNKLLSEFGSINVNTDQLTFKASGGRRSNARDGTSLTQGGVEQTELKVGDGVRICDETFYVTALGTLTSDSLIPSVTVDHVATKTCTDFYVYKHLVTQSRPVGDWEMWVGDYHGSGNMHDVESSGVLQDSALDVSDATKGPSGRYAEDEGHFYMECSNQGLCDCKTGVCECFDGYTGVACARQACPNDCSGHGTCQSVGELRSQKPVKLMNSNSEKPATCYGSRGSDQLICDTAVSVVNNDYIQIHPYPPMKIKTITGNTITLFNHFPDAVPYGTEIFKVSEYGLWDADKNSACVCDPRWSGDDCSLKKCPRGDDPLTVVSTDTNANGPGSKTDSDYTQRPEKQTLIIDSAEQGAIGHFYLHFTDFYGDSFSTLPIPLEVQLSVQAKVSTTTVTFEGAGLPADELTRGDTVRIGSSYKRVTQLTYKETDSTSTRGLFIATATLDTGAISGNGGSGEFLDGTRIYRTDVSKEIREALLSVPNGRIEGVSVEKIDRTGRYVTTVGTNYESGTNDGDTIAATNGTGIVAGDIIRAGKHLARVEAVSSNDLKIKTTLVNDDLKATTPLYIQNGARYRINFETGCRSDSECNSNGVDADDSDAGAICTLGGSCLCSDAADTSSNWPKATNDYFYHGKGCTASGKGNHQGAYIRSNNGNIPALTCDKSRIYSGYVTHISAAVRRTSPQKIHFEKTVGSKDVNGNADFKTGKRVYIEGQVRTITKVENAVLTVDEPFKTNEFSDDTYVFPTGSWVYLLHRDGGAGITCTASDITPLTSTSLAKTIFTSVHSHAEGVISYKAVTGSVNAKRVVTINTGSANSAVQDEDELHVGDRVRLQSTSDASVFETRTVDEIFYNSANEITSFTVDSAIDAPDSAKVYIYVDNRGTTEEITCSRRGLCDESTGTCECFSGYTDDDCSRQDSLFAA